MYCSLCNGHLEMDMNTVLSCEHKFHSECINLWFRRNITCPECRLVYPKIKDCINMGILNSIVNIKID